MTESELRTQSNKYNAVTSKTQGYQEIRNSAENWHLIMEYYKSGRAKDLSHEAKKLNAPVFITGSGPSLDKAIFYLKSWKGDIVTHYSQALTLMYHGIEPDYIVALDAICNFEGLDGVDWSKTKTKLVCHPGVWPSLFEKWPNDFLLYRQNMGDANAFAMNEQKLMYTDRKSSLQEALDGSFCLDPMIKTEITMFACTPPTQLFVAQVLQYGAVFLAGLDFAYHDNQERFTNYVKQDGKWIGNTPMLPDPDNPRITTNNGLKTDQMHLYYKKNFISACRLSMQRVFSTDEGAILPNEIPYADIEKVVKSGGKVKDITPEQRMWQYEKYLAKQDCFILEFARGYSFVEVVKPVENAEGFQVRDITSNLIQRNRYHSCSMKGCEQSFMVNDDKDHSGENCPVCGHKSLYRTNPANIEKNVARVKKLLEAIK